MTGRHLFSSIINIILNYIMFKYLINIEVRGMAAPLFPTTSNIILTYIRKIFYRSFIIVVVVVGRRFTDAHTNNNFINI